MRKILDARVGNIVKDIRTNIEYKVVDIYPFTYSNLLTEEMWTISETDIPTIKRWFKIVSEDTTQVVEQQLTTNSQNNNINNVEQLYQTLINMAISRGCLTKQNSDHLAIKYNNKNIIALRHTKKAVHMTFRQSILDDVMVQYIADNFKGKLVGNGKWALNYRASNIDTIIFEDILSIAISQSR